MASDRTPPIEQHLTDQQQRRVDKSLARLQSALDAAGLDLTPTPSETAAPIKKQKEKKKKKKTPLNSI